MFALDLLYRRRLFETAGLVMIVGRIDENHIKHEKLDGPYTFMDADDCNEPRDDLHPFTSADKYSYEDERTRMARTKQRVTTPGDVVDRTP